MKVRVLVVDDSSFFRRRVETILATDPLLEICGCADNGEQAVALNRELQPDVITMDVEMPVMNGIEAVRQIMRERRAPILMLSSLTRAGASATLDALEAGAVDFLPKQMELLAGHDTQAQKLLCARLVALGLRNRGAARGVPRARASVPAAVPAPAGGPTAGAHPGQFRLLLIGASTGGPIALQRILPQLPGDFPLPVVVIQHMPASFTPTFAERMDLQSPLHVMEARDGDALRAGGVYVAPGGRQLEIVCRGDRALARVTEAEENSSYRPSVDAAFFTAAEAFPGKVLALVLTGMGRDGCEGARRLKRGGSTVWAQDEASSVIYGMPKAVVNAGMADQVLALKEIAGNLCSAVQ